MSILLGLTILDAGVPLSMVCAVIGLAFALVLIAIVGRSSAGNERMRQISAAVQEGAKAYLNRQVITISVIAAIIFVLLFFFKDHPTGIGFVIGAFCSLAAGDIGMRIAEIARRWGIAPADSRQSVSARKLPGARSLRGDECAE